MAINSVSVLRTVAPSGFLWYPLSTGALCSAITFICVTCICVIVLTVQVLLMKSCTACGSHAWRNAYSLCVCGVSYCLIMLLMHGWLICGIRHEKTTVLICWVVITSIWLSQTFFLLIILLYMHDIRFNASVLSFTIGLIPICILLYFILVVLGLWFKLKDAKKPQTNSRVVIQKD